MVKSHISSLCGQNHYLFPSVSASTFFPSYLFSPFIKKTYLATKNPQMIRSSVCVLSTTYFCLLFWALHRVIFLLKFSSRIALPAAEVGHLSRPCICCL